MESNYTSYPKGHHDIDKTYMHEVNFPPSSKSEYMLESNEYMSISVDR